MAAKYPRVLYFIAGPNPSEEDLEAAKEFGPGVLFRNANFVPPEGPLENADAVAGPAIPKRYRDAYSAKGKGKYANDLARGRRPGDTSSDWHTGREADTDGSDAERKSTSDAKPTKDGDRKHK